MRTSFKNLLRKSGIAGPILEAANGAYVALFEGLRPPQKTRRLLRNILPEPPGGWDSPAIDKDDGAEHVSTAGNVLSWIQALEAHIRNELLHTRGMNDKFEPGLARIYYGELKGWPDMLKDYTGEARDAHKEDLKVMKNILRLISGYHAEEYDGDLNGMSLEDLKRQFAREPNQGAQVADVADTGHTDYRVEYIPSFEAATEYAKYMPEGTGEQWCITVDRKYWRNYTNKGENTVYFLMAPGFEDVPHEETEGCPKDRYGLSLIGLMVSPEGDLTSCCVRWNHRHGGSDMELDEKELGELLGRPLRVLCPPREDDNEDVELTYARLARYLEECSDPDAVYVKYGFENLETIYPGIVSLCNPNVGTLLIDETSRLPVFEEIFSYIRHVHKCDDGIPVYVASSISGYDDDRETNLFDHYIINLEKRTIGVIASDDEYETFESPLVEATSIPGIYTFSFDSCDFDNDLYDIYDEITLMILIDENGNWQTSEHITFEKFGDDVIIGDLDLLDENSNTRAFAVYRINGEGKLQDIIPQDCVDAAACVYTDDGTERVVAIRNKLLYIFSEDGNHVQKDVYDAEIIKFPWSEHTYVKSREDKDSDMVLFDVNLMKPVLQAYGIFEDGTVQLVDEDTGRSVWSKLGPAMLQ